MKRGNIRSFLAGAATTLIVISAVTTALAASGTVSFNRVNLAFNNVTVCREGKSMQTAAGAKIPSTISYTDELGGNTTYVPLRQLAERLNMEIEWDGTDNTVRLDPGYLVNLYNSGIHGAGTKIGPVAEVVPQKEHEGNTLLKETNYQSKDVYKTTLAVNAKKGNYVNITVTNHDIYPIELTLGYNAEDCTLTIPRQVPAGETVTRTILLDESAAENELIQVFAGYSGDFTRPVNLTVSAVQF